MGELSSFYGGRQGASFVIVKRFDGLDIPNDVYRVGWYAQDAEGYFYVPLIEKNVSNYASYPSWGTVPKDGTTTVTSKSGITSDPLPVEYAEGMKQCFEKGGASSSEVGYGEYVIIDTITGLGEYNNPDNGKVYRRGMNYDSDLGGAEYIGQIVGPKSGSPKIEMSTVADILGHTESQSREYIMTDGSAQDGIVPGKFQNIQGEVLYNDAITYGWATLRDIHNNIIGALIGFTFPYLVPEITSISRSAYYTREDYDLGRITDENLIGTIIKEEDNFLLFVDNGFDSEDRDPTHGDTGHAFYRRWKLSIPHGVKGDAQTQLEIVPQKVRAGAPLWLSEDFDEEPECYADDNVYVILEDSKFNEDCVYPYKDPYAPIEVRKESEPGIVHYARIEDTYMLKIRYRQTTYDRYDGDIDYQMLDLGNYNTIRKVWLADDGYLWVSYNADEDSFINGSPIQWFDNIDVLNDGTIVFTYNTINEETGEHNKQIFEKVIPWITNALINQDGTFTLTYNNETNADTYPEEEWNSETHTWTKVLNFIDHVTIDGDGTIHFYYSNGEEASNVGYENIKIKYLIGADVNTGLNFNSEYDFEGEGTGNQKINLIWNTETTPGVKDSEDIGAPLNYVMETVVTTYDPKSPNTPQNHLLVLYSDPAYREWLIENYPNKIYRYTSQKFTKQDPSDPDKKIFVTRDDWYDLGYVKGEPGGLHIIGQFRLNTGETYQDYLVDGVPPEQMTHNPEYRGWAYLIVEPVGAEEIRVIYTYDYPNNKWIVVSDLSSAAAIADPTQIVILDSESIDPTTGRLIPETPEYIFLPKENGLWLVKREIKTAY